VIRKIVLTHWNLHFRAGWSILQAAWNDAFVEECVAFPRGNHDDQVDAASSAYNKLLSMLRKIQKEVKSYPG
jgi:predicted phage terminase large subunit-like protein